MRYEKKNILFLLTLFCCTGLGSVANAQSRDMEKIKTFLNDCVNDSINDETIIQQHLCLDIEKYNPTAKAESLKYIKKMLDLFRISVKKRSLQTISIKKYSEIPPECQILWIDEKHKPHIYAYSSDETTGCPSFILVHDGKIASFMRMAMGDEARWLLLTCSLD